MKSRPNVIGYGYQREEGMSYILLHFARDDAHEEGKTSNDDKDRQDIVVVTPERPASPEVVNESKDDPEVKTTIHSRFGWCMPARYGRCISRECDLQGEECCCPPLFPGK
ncbi:uncharacterized protein LOC117334467 [Pecten maximus]|uniref:uncharacterized protein LOC117334467 n=1 Tax=Pecten maximus TaxID=6579 RepID=UPI00145916BB|nr:uncharacterized protein LOC117334467 [Pecten maximus]